MPKHKHSDVIKAWADGTAIQCKPAGYSEWIDVTGPFPSFANNCEYRLKPVPHKWQKEMDAYAAGKVVQVWSTTAIARQKFDWQKDNPSCIASGHPQWDLASLLFSIKPELVVMYGKTSLAGLSCEHDKRCSVFNIAPIQAGNDDVKFTFEDGKLVKAEVL